MKPAISVETSVEELAAIVSRALEEAGIAATLSGGAAITLYAENQYVSGDLDFVTNARMDVIAKALAPLGFVTRKGVREFRHPDTELYVEFPPGPLAFGETVVGDRESTMMHTEYGPLRIVTPTQIVMDRLAAFVHWHDGQAYDQAVMVARHQKLEWGRLYAWAEREGVARRTVEQLQERSSGS